MADLLSPSAHTFHIPVMGTGFTIDTPLRVAKYGISSVVSLSDDILIEQMRKYHCEREGEVYEEISRRDIDARARRITAYLNLLDRLVQRQVKTLQSSTFEEGSEITRYYELLPEVPLKETYRDMLATSDLEEKSRMRAELRHRAVPGRIDVNVMTKIDRDIYRGREKLPAEYSAAMAALRGFANSTLCSSIVFSAGLNLRLYGYINKFKDFLPDDDGVLNKKITLKVSDYRSAVIQGKFLAKRGLWVSEYRIESGLNCGGHAFVTNGYLMGPILEEFKQHKQELIDTLYPIYSKGLHRHGCSQAKAPHDVRITVQGGIGSAAENEFLLEYYSVDGTGWATPFLLVPDVANVDDAHLEKLQAATDDDVFLSSSSPFGISLWNLRVSASEENRRRRISEGWPGSPCPKGFLVSNKEFTTIPICIAAGTYQRRKLEDLREENIPSEQRRRIEEAVLAKSCLCDDLAGGVQVKYGIDKNAKTAVCCGPDIVNFSKIATLEEMVSHIYGRLSLLTNLDRPHMFIRELVLYVDYLREEINKYLLGLSTNTPKYLREFKENLLRDIEYYRLLAKHLQEDERPRFLRALQNLGEEIKDIFGEVEVEICVGSGV